MKKIINIIILINFFFISYANASIKNNIISKFENIQNLSFKFKQNINEKIETGDCIIQYPKKIYCEYNNLNKKLLVSNGKHLVIKNQTSNQYYIYPIEKTALNLILDKDFLLKKINLSVGELIDEKYYRFRFLEGDNEINEFFYKQIGKKHQWTDRLVWREKDWIKYVSNENLKTYILKENEDLVGYVELIFDKDECEIAYLGILEEYIGKNLGGYLLSEAIKIGFEIKMKRIWVHTCSLDHQNAILNYKARGMKIFKNEVLKRKVI